MDWKKFLSRKFIITLLILGLAAIAPVLYKEKGVTDSIVMAVLGILAGVGFAYGVVSNKDPKEIRKVESPK